MPFVTVLRALDGQLSDFTVNTPPWPVQLPRLAQQAPSAETAQAQIPKAIHTAPPPIAQPLILSGKKPQSEEPPAPAPETPSAKESPAANTVKPLVPPATPAQTAKAETTQVVPVRAAVAVSPTPSTAPLTVPEPKMEIAQVPETKPIASSPVTSQATLAPPPPAHEPTPAARDISSPAPSKIEAAPPVPTPAPKPVVAVAASRETSSDVTAAQAASPAPSTVPAPLGQTAAAAPRVTLIGWPMILIVGLVLAGLAIGFALLLRRRSHAASGASLITQSFERKNKP